MSSSESDFLMHLHGLLVCMNNDICGFSWFTSFRIIHRNTILEVGSCAGVDLNDLSDERDGMSAHALRDAYS